MSTRNSLVPRTLDEAMQLATILSQSTIVPKEYQGNPGNVLVAIQWGMELGLLPLQAMQNIAVINGRPSIWGDAMLALVRSSGLLEAMDEQLSPDGRVATCTVQRRGEAPVTRTFSIEDAKRAGLASKAGPWQQYQPRMLQMRARGYALRDVFPDVLRGLWLAEEALDIPTVQPPVAPAPAEQPADPAEPKTARLRRRLATKTASEPPAAAQPAEQPAPTASASPPSALQEVMEMIQASSSLDELAAVADYAAKLTDDERAQARVAYSARAAALKEEAASNA